MAKSNIITKQEGGKILFYWNNNKYLGYSYREVDGLYVFQFDAPDHGVWGDYALKEISDKIFELNKDYRAHLDEYFRKHGSLLYKFASFVHRRPFTFAMIILLMVTWIVVYLFSKHKI